MTGYLIDRLYPTGWRRDGQIWWRYRDAEEECDRALAKDFVRGVRILPVRVLPDAISERMREEATR